MFFFIYVAKSRRRRNWTLRNFCRNNKKWKFQKDITWSMEPSSDTKWCGPRDHMVTQGLIGVWHKDNLYLGTSTIGNGDPHPTNIDSRTRSIRMTPRRQLFFDKLFFQFFRKPWKGDYLTNTNTHTKCSKQEVLLIWIVWLTCLVMLLFILTLDLNKP